MPNGSWKFEPDNCGERGGIPPFRRWKTLDIVWFQLGTASFQVPLLSDSERQRDRVGFRVQDGTLWGTDYGNTGKPLSKPSGMVPSSIMSPTRT